jgi:uncharacterized protein (TIGR00255 family)
MSPSQPSAIASMTGFARCKGGDKLFTWTWEAKSVNGRVLEPRFRLPPGWDSLEPPARERIQRRFARGSLYISLLLQPLSSTAAVTVNEPLLKVLMDLSVGLATRIGGPPPRAESLLAMRGVLQEGTESEPEEERAARERAMLADLDQVLQRLLEARCGEGERLAALVVRQLDEIGRLTESARTLAATQPERLRVRLLAWLQEAMASLPPLPEERLAQEVALLATKADVQEELDRLQAHLEQAHALLREGRAIGRRLDFLCQEFNREANTLCSKSSDIALTRLGLDLKTRIEQLREQVQNIE